MVGWSVKISYNFGEVTLPWILSENFLIHTTLILYWQYALLTLVDCGSILCRQAQLLVDQLAAVCCVAARGQVTATLRLSPILFPRKKIPISQIIYFLKCNPYVPLFVFRSVGSQKGGKLHLHTPIGAHFFRLLATGFDGVFKY